MAIAREGRRSSSISIFSPRAFSSLSFYPHRSRQFFLRPLLSYLLPEVDLSVKRSGFYRDACGDALKLAAMTTKVIHLFQRHYKIASETNSKSQAMLRSESR
jgi:hypothetical protein